MPRTLQLIKVKPSGGHRTFIIGNTHLAFHISSTLARSRQVRAVLDALKSASKHEFPVVLCGDLNDVPESEAVRLLFSDPEFLFQDSWAVAGEGSDGITFSRENPWAKSELFPGRRIDFIAASKEFVMHSCRLAMTPNDYGAVSDHYAVFSEIELTP
jgi:endonuclease/exonuclease/phosphatase family metal-dependent hydrolase